MNRLSKAAAARLESLKKSRDWTAPSGPQDQAVMESLALQGYLERHSDGQGTLYRAMYSQRP
jgi:hypothetical protein